MSTKSTIRSEHDPETGQGFHLYSDWLDQCDGVDIVHLQLDGIAFEAAANGSRSSVTAQIPRKMAERLGLIQT